MYHYVQGDDGQALYRPSRSLGQNSKTAMMVFAVVMMPFAYLFYTDRPVARHVPAEPYVWPAGCKFIEVDSAGTRHYGHEFPQACMDPQYYIADPGKYRLPASIIGKVRNYYRVGPDAINVDCLSDRPCVVAHVEQDVFSDSGSSQEAVPQNPVTQG
jgi:hypothetical protein